MGATFQAQAVARGHEGSMVARRNIPDDRGEVDGVAPGLAAVGGAAHKDADGIGHRGLEVAIVAGEKAEHVAVLALHQRRVTVAFPFALALDEGLRFGPCLAVIRAATVDNVDVLRQVAIIVLAAVVDSQQCAVVQT